MARIELWTTLFAGLAGGLAGVLWSGLVSSHWLARGGAAPTEPPRDTLAHIVLASAWRAGAGAALGFLFWLGWGLIAVVGWPWYVIGLLYGALSWSALAAPTLATLALRSPASRRIAAVHAAEWLFTCLAIGLLCALSWHRYA